MKKKILLTLFLVLAMMLTLVLVASAETPSLYIEFKVKLSGAEEYTTAYTKNVNSAANPKFSFNENFYSDVDFTQAIDKSTIVGIDISEAVTRATANSNTGTVKELVSSSTALTSVEEIKFPTASTFTTIPSNCCKNWTSLKTIDFGNANKISDNGFQGTAVEEVTIPATMVRMNNQSFYQCTQLKKLTFLGATDLGDSKTFAGCTALTDVDLGSIPVVQGSMFNGCSSLTSITLPETVTRIGSTAFMGTGLTSLHIPASCTEIGVQMVEGLTSFTTITFAENSQLKKISHRAFKGTGLTAIDLPEGIEEIAYSAFEGSALTSIEFPASLKTLSYSVLSGCKSLTSVSFADGFYIEGWDSDGFFFNCSSLESVKLPSCISKISSNAFAGTALTSIVIPGTVTEIESRAFYNVKTLTSITFMDKEKITVIGKEAFYNVPSTDLFVPSKVTSIGESAYNASGLTGEVIIPKTCTSVGNSAFWSCTKVTSVVFEEGFSGTLGSSSFCGLNNLSKLVLVEGITSVPSQCFWSSGDGDDGKQFLIESVTLPDSVQTLAGRAFSGLGTKEFIIKETSNLSKITGDAFSGMSEITEIYLPKGVEITNGSVFNYCNKLEVIHNLEYAVMNINGEAVFPVGMLYQCMALKEVRIPEGVTKITGNIFRWYGLEKLYIPSSVTTIEGSFVAKDHVPNTATIYFCGGDADDLVAMCTSGNAFIQGKIDAGSVAEYSSLDATYGSGAIVNNVNNCDVYYAGIHEENDNITLVWLDKDGNAGEAFLSYLKVACPCGRSCGVETVIETLAPLFVDRGFAYGPNSMLQGVAVDRELLDEYGKYFTGIKYGLVAAAKNAQASASIIDANGVGANGYVAAVDYTERDYDLFEMNLFGISEDYQATEFYFGAYVIADGQVYYIHNGTTNNEAQAIAYDDVVMIVDALIPEKEEE